MTDLTMAALEQMLQEVHQAVLDRSQVIWLSPTKLIIPKHVYDMLAEIKSPEEEHYAARNGE